jgi:hypothetical protein
MVDYYTVVYFQVGLLSLLQEWVCHYSKEYFSSQHQKFLDCSVIIAHIELMARSPDYS